MSFNRQHRKNHAISHVAFINSNYAKEIQSSIVKARIYEPNTAKCNISIKDKHTKQIVEETDAVGAAIKYASYGKVALLDFASYKNPGGGFMGGSLAQEEAICAQSTLYPVLLSFESTYYEPNRKHTNRSLYSDRTIYVPDIVFFENEIEKATTDVIVCAAPNRGAALSAGVDEYECLEALKKRINTALSIAFKNNCDIVIAGAFGCGVFKNNPEDVANIFNTWIKEHDGVFEQVIYAIPHAGSENFVAFQNIIT